VGRALLTVVLWKWHGRTMGHTRPDYGAGHVNRVAAAVDRWLAMPHRIVCVTDDATGIDGGVTAIPLWDDLRGFGRCFVRLKAFARDAASILGPRFVSLDLDTVVCGPLDPLFDRPEPFVIWADPSRLLPYCGSMWMLNAGHAPQVFESFDYAVWRTLKPERNWHGSDQAWMAYTLPGAATWGRADGVYSFRLDILRRRGAELLPGRFRRLIRRAGPPKLPEKARIVHFHGMYDPSQKYLQETIPWIREHWNQERP